VVLQGTQAQLLTSLHTCTSPAAFKRAEHVARMI
jgi:hypothetical protein